jgi:hypothetical protein
MSSIGNLSSNYLQSVLGSINSLQNSGSTANTAASSASGISAASDNGQLSPFAQIMSTLQQLQQSNPTQYQQVTQQIATNLQSAAKTATADGNTNAANQLNQLATDFTSASQSGQLPNMQDLAKAIGGGHHHHHHGHAASTDSDSNSSAAATSTGTASTTTSGTTGGTSTTNSSSPTVSQLLAEFQSNGTQSDSLNPLAIIANTLSSAGIS